MTYTLFTTNTCVFCQSVKKVLDSKGKKYDVIDVTDDYGRRLELQQKFNATTVPVLVREDGQFMVGFNQPKLFSML